MNERLEQSMQVIWIRLTADRRKFGAMCGLAAVGILLWSRLILLEDVPRSTFADPDAETPAHNASATTGSDDGASQNARRQRLPELRIELPTEDVRNLFVMRPEFLAHTAQVDPTPPVTPKSQTDPSEEIRERERKERIATEKAIRAMKLSSIVQGRTPIVVIDGRVLRVGDVHKGFRIARVTVSSVTLTKNSVEFELQMESGPGF